MRESSQSVRYDAWAIYYQRNVPFEMQKFLFLTDVRLADSKLSIRLSREKLHINESVNMTELVAGPGRI